MLNLQKNKNHNLPSHVAFIYLVKAYDTANHNILLHILELYGTPPCFVAAVAHIYQDLIIVLKIDRIVPIILGMGNVKVDQIPAVNKAQRIGRHSSL
jgi:hypothetical protein